jgi:adenine phosphoribosyltransferase
MSAELKRHIVDVPDFPKAGILFRDITPLLRNHFASTLAALDRLFSDSEWRGVDALAGIESRGFVPIRKHGKLPPPVVSAAYALEYGTGVLEMQRGRGCLLIIDDVLATGGTMQASAELCSSAGFEVAGFGVLIDLRLSGDFAWRGLPLRTAITYE